MTDFKKDVILTGIPRGGTTLSAALLDNLKNAVCLSEPRWQSPWFKNFKDVNKVTEFVMNDYKNIRNKIRDNKPIKDIRNKDGTPLTNYYSERRKGRRFNVRKHGAFTFEIENENFLLAMKHNEHYTGILPQLLETGVFSIIAIVRHPVPTILSWKSLNLYISNGRMPYAEPFWKELREITCSSDKSLLTFVKIYDLFCQRYLSFSNEIHLLKYEKIIKNPQVFEELTGLTYKNKVELSSRNQSKNYNFALAEDIKNLITIHAPNALKLYQMDDESIS
ncbi:sulfotransferase [Neobacillus drentensis]|uniref:sulfotransferase n=1 Tax=Neobacillus drentensis TaxID=220684 RepID=UPI002FFE1B90